MPTNVLIFASLFSIVGLLMIGIAVPLIRRRIAPNGLYGLRVPATFSDEWVWYEANARSGRDLAILGGIQFSIALVPPLVADLSPGAPAITYALANVAFAGVGAVTLAIVGWIRANRLLKKRHGL
jgi:hypothetical protein